MSEELKPCPFCGHRKILQTSGDGYFISCMKCGSRGSKKMYCESMSGAIAAWNTRPLEDEKDNEIESLKVELNNLWHFFDSILDKAKRNKGVLYFKQNSGTWKIETGKGDATDNYVGSMEEKK